MKTKLTKYLSLVLLFCGVLLSSCGSDNDNALKNYKNGVIVINEGNFTDGDASVSFINTTKGEVYTGLFSEINDDAPLGDVANDALLHDGSLYIVVNNSNKMEVVNGNNFALNYTISDLSQPRSFEVHNGIGYVTEWGVYPDPAQISVIDLGTGNVTSTLTPGSGAEDIVFVNNDLYVSNQFENTISVIDLDGEDETETISTGSSPDDMVVDANGKIWVICGGGYDFEPPYAALNNGQLQRINPSDNTVEATIELNANVTGRLALDAAGENLFYLNGNSVYKISVTANSEPTSSFVDVTDAVSLYGIGVDPENGDVYALDSNGFQTNGKAFRFSASGEAIDTYTVGRGPNKVIFN